MQNINHIDRNAALQDRKFTESSTVWVKSVNPLQVNFSELWEPRLRNPELLQNMSPFN